MNGHPKIQPNPNSDLSACGGLRTASSLFFLLAASTLLFGCASGAGGDSSAGPAVPNPYSAGAPSGSAKVATLRVFGDSYSETAFTNLQGTKNWVNELGARGITQRSENYAISGARAARGEAISFDQQINNWKRRNSALQDQDLTVVYLGHNDIGRTGSRDGLRSAQAGLAAGINTLLVDGAATENRRLFLTQIHDWSRNPAVLSSLNGQVVSWNNFIAGQANAHANVIAVDMFTVFERIYQDPAKYGFVNVRSPNRARSATDALYVDTRHFGSRGQEIISRVYQHYLTRGWNWANSVGAGAAAAASLNADIDRETLVLKHNPQALQTTAFRLVPLHNQDSRSVNPGPTAKGPHAAIPTMGFLLDFQGKPRANGVNSQWGLAVSQKNQHDWSQSRTSPWPTAQKSSSAGLYWHQPLSGYLLSSQVNHMGMELDHTEVDDILLDSTRNKYQVNTWSFNSKLRKTFEPAAGLVTPWAMVSHHIHETPASTARSLYTSDVQFAGMKHSRSALSIGMDFASHPIVLEGGNRLVFSGGFQHLQSLDKGPLEVSWREMSNPGLWQREFLSPSSARRTTVSLGGDYLMRDGIRLQGRYNWQRDGAELQSQFSLSANIPF